MFIAVLFFGHTKTMHIIFFWQTILDTIWTFNLKNTLPTALTRDNVVWRSTKIKPSQVKNKPASTISMSA